MKKTDRTEWFQKARFGLFIHYGLYSMLGRGEWVMNREKIQPETYRKLADKFTAKYFDADYICGLAANAGMKYVVLTTMHHDGFRLYDSKLSDYNSMKSPAKRDLTAEIIRAARKRGMKIGLYHSLNNWYDQPDSVSALESKKNYELFIKNTHERLRELVTKYKPFDTMWYDGWWPFNSKQWQAVKMNKMVQKIQPHIIFNGRNGLPGDFSTPEGHMSAPSIWRPWEGCMTLNEHWGFHAGDTKWKSAGDVIDLLAKAAGGKGNLLLNIGPEGDGTVPAGSVKVLEDLAKWMKVNKECVFDTDIFNYDLQKRGAHRGDWMHHGHFTAKGKTLYAIVRFWPGKVFIISGLECEVRKISMLGKSGQIPFKQEGDILALLGMPEKSPCFCPVIKIECDRPPVMYQTGGMRNPRVPHPHYDPCPSDIML